MTTQATITVNDDDLLTIANFAKLAQAAFAGLSVLPNATVYAAASRITRRRRAVIDAVADRDGIYTVYSVSREGADRPAELLLIDAATGATIDLLDQDAAEDLGADWLADNPAVAQLIAD